MVPALNSECNFAPSNFAKARVYFGPYLTSFMTSRHALSLEVALFLNHNFNVAHRSFFF